MTQPKRQREAPLSVRLPKALRLRLVHGAAVAGMSLNAYVVRKLFEDRPVRSRGKTPVRDQQSLSKALGLLGSLNTVLRDLVRLGLLDIFPDLESDLRRTFLKIRQACDAIMSALGRPGDLT